LAVTNVRSIRIRDRVQPLPARTADILGQLHPAFVIIGSVSSLIQLLDACG
jgi:hypothetical protein